MNFSVLSKLDSQLPSGFNPEDFTNKELIEWCSRLGTVAIKSRRLFIGLLPLVARRRAYDVRKFSSIHHFAAMVGGVSRKSVNEVLRLDSQLSRLPLLRKALYSGEIGWSKIRAVILRVTPENQKEWLVKLRDLSKPALEIYLRDFKRQERDERKNLFSVIDVSSASQNASLSSSFSGEIIKNKAESLPGEKTRLDTENVTSQSVSKTADGQSAVSTAQPLSPKLQSLSLERETISFSASRLVVARLRLFRQKLEKQSKQWVTLEQAIVELLGLADM
jgi:hypothetical protein